MEPFSMAASMGLGLGLQALGGIIGYGAGQEYNTAQKEQIGHEQNIESQRMQAMELDAQRKKLQNIRDAQVANATSLSRGVNQGAQFSSGVAGGRAQVSGEAGVNELGINQSLMIGRNIFAENRAISQNRITMANAQQEMQLGQGVSQFGSSIFGGSQAFGRLFSGFGNT